MEADAADIEDDLAETSHSPTFGLPHGSQTLNPSSLGGGRFSSCVSVTQEKKNRKKIDAL